MTGSISLAGRAVLITGGTSGIGFHTAAALGQMGATVYVTGRDDARGRDAERRLRELAGRECVRFIKADASTVGGNQWLARRLRELTDRLHVLVNNVGGLFNDRLTSADGYELTLAMNFVGPVALTQALLPLLQQSAPARIVNIVSSGHAMWSGDPFADLHAETSYLGLPVHARAKLLNVLWTLALARRVEGSDVVVNATNPGMAWTTTTKDLARRAMPTAQRFLLALVPPHPADGQCGARGAGADLSRELIGGCRALGCVSGEQRTARTTVRRRARPRKSGARVGARPVPRRRRTNSSPVGHWDLGARDTLQPDPR